MVSLNRLSLEYENWTWRRDNPHEVTAEQINAYTTSDIDAIFEGFIPSDWLPMSSFGNQLKSTLDMDVVTGLGVITFTFHESMMTTVQNGTKVPFEQATWSFKVIRNATNHLYCTQTVTGDRVVAYISAYAQPRKDSSTDFYIGSIINTNDNMTHTLAPAILLGSRRLSPVPRGGSIPVSTGLPTEKGQYQW